MSGAHLDYKLGISIILGDKLEDALQVMLLQPIDDKAVRGEQFQYAVVIYGLQRPNPRVELLLRQLRLEDACALVPKRRIG